jgi:hypothetical protein
MHPNKICPPVSEIKVIKNPHRTVVSKCIAKEQFGREKEGYWRITRLLEKCSKDRR